MGRGILVPSFLASHRLILGPSSALKYVPKASARRDGSLLSLLLSDIGRRGSIFALRSFEAASYVVDHADQGPAERAVRLGSTSEYKKSRLKTALVTRMMHQRDSFLSLTAITSILRPFRRLYLLHYYASHLDNGLLTPIL